MSENLSLEGRPVKNENLLLNLICAALAVVFLVVAALNVSWAGNFLTIDGLFFSTVCLVGAVVFLINPALTLISAGYLRNPFKRTAASTEAPQAGPVEEPSRQLPPDVIGVMYRMDPEHAPARPVRYDIAVAAETVHPAAAHEVVEEVHFEGSNRLFVAVWLWLLGLTAVEIFLAYIHVPVHLMLTILLGLSVVKAALIMAYFMHLRFERLSLVLTLVPVLVLCICLLLVFFPDSVRLLNLRVYR